jgi:hypothetical protein
MARPESRVIRYVLAAVLVVALLGLAAAGVDEGATARGETETASIVEQVDTAAVDLYENEALALTGTPPPQRLLEVTLPGAGDASRAPTHVTFERVSGEALTQVTYRFPGRAGHSRFVEAPLVREGDEEFRLDGHTGAVQLVLRLVPDENGRPVVSISVRT